jgi:single-strand DNA-binding protein
MEQNKDGMWEKKSTDFYNVKILTGNKGLNIGAVASIKKGDPLIVFGNLVKSSYIRQDGTQGTNLDITAQKIGHDLSKGISAFVKFMHTNQNVNQNNQNNQNMQNNQNVNTTNINAPTTTQNNLNNQNANNTTTPPIHTVNGRPVSVASDIKRPVINNNNNNSSLGKLNYQPINSNNMGF